MQTTDTMLRVTRVQTSSLGALGETGMHFGSTTESYKVTSLQEHVYTNRSESGLPYSINNRRQATKAMHLSTTSVSS
jgi:hypothetical protein